VNYVGEEDSTHISRFSVTESNPDLADPDSEFQLMTIFQPYSNHKEEICASAGWVPSISALVTAVLAGTLKTTPRIQCRTSGKCFE